MNSSGSRGGDMTRRLLNRVRFFILLLAAVVPNALLRADTVTLKDGTEIQGIIKKVEAGQVTIESAKQTTTIDILKVGKMEFDMPALETGTPRLPVEHFIAGMEAQEMTQHVQAVEDAAARLQSLIAETKKEWSGRKSIDPAEVKQWDAARERFIAPLGEYQEALNDLYFHVLGKVDEYHHLTKQANAIHVGVKGVFNVGSPLISKNMQRLPLKKYVPTNWYDTIFYEGYDLGYNDAFEKYGVQFHRPYEPPAAPTLETSKGD
jgi:hypothetical protein